MVNSKNRRFKIYQSKDLGSTNFRVYGKNCLRLNPLFKIIKRTVHLNSCR